ncbi:response regulator transcription factor [Companilactobacillus metriopterae]|uniref:response regulator transcription factor n=1 Tax=Companilactobacillus metriopterae TaxID=1909267 RepID=UPI00100BC577|nr:response regulator transcription factor [Companilactobacillus metriopterae]
MKTQTNNAKILVVDDQKSIVELLKYNLEESGYDLNEAYDGLSAYEMSLSGDYDLIILDQMLPELSGIETLKKLRSNGITTPVIFLTALDTEDKKIEGLVSGADDYITKPFSINELLARIDVVLRRTMDKSDSKKTNLTLTGKSVEVRGKKIPLTKKEYKVLEYLVSNSGQILSRDQIFENIWGLNSDSQIRMVDIQISHLRDKIEINSKEPEIIKTVHGFGYILGE